MSTVAKSFLHTGQATKLLRFPDFIGIGVQKAGTTWIENNIRYHPEIWMPAIKELHYFDHLYIPKGERGAIPWRRDFILDRLKWHFKHKPENEWDFELIAELAHIAGEGRTDEWYGEIFANASPYQVCGEITPDYALLPERAIKHLVALSPDVKIIIALRDPIERDWSQIRMLARENGLDPVEHFHKILRDEDVVNRTDYVGLLNRWSKYVPHERLHVVFLDEIETDPIAAITGICRFLDIEHHASRFPNAADRANAGPETPMPEAIYGLLKERLRSLYQELYHLFPEMAEKWNARHYGHDA